MPTLQYKSVPKSLLCVKHKLCAPWSPNAGGHNKYLVNGAKNTSGDLNSCVYRGKSTYMNELCCQAWGNVVRHAHGPPHLAGFGGSIALHGKLMHACCQVTNSV